MLANLDGRYPHFLRRLNGCTKVDRILCVDVSSTIKVNGKYKDERIETFSRWHAFALTRYKGQLGITLDSSGDKEWLFWDLLEHELRHSGMVWVVSYQCSRVWALIGLWEQLKKRSVRISSSKDCKHKKGDNNGTVINGGVFVLEDPPCIAQLRIRKATGLIQWIDIRNWGIEYGYDVIRGESLAKRVANTVMSIDEHVACKTGQQLCVTAASFASKLFRRKHMSTVPYCHVNPNVLDLESNAHIGGRCECFRIGLIKEEVYHVDFRSCYGSIMSNRDLPVRLIKHDIQPFDKDVQNAAMGNSVLAKVTISTQLNEYPYRREHDIIYPTGTFTTYLCAEELKSAFLLGRITKIHEAAYYQMSTVFSGLARELYRLRCAADINRWDGVSEYCKCVINSLPGKMGERCKRWETIQNCIAPFPWGEWYKEGLDGELDRYRSIAGVVQKQYIGGYAPDAVPAIAVWINSYGRSKLWNAMSCAGLVNCYYVDTDCLIVNHKGYVNLCMDNMVENGEIGKLEMKCRSKDVSIRGIKYYIMDDVIKCAGLARGNVTTDKNHKDKWLTAPIGDAAKHHEEPGMRQRILQLPMPAPYTHGVVDASGYVMPITINEEVP